MSTEKTGHIRKFAGFLAQHDIIDGWMKDGAVKESFARLGKKALSELAVYLGLKDKHYQVSFNKAGLAVSGDLHLAGMFGQGQGIYISISKDGLGNGILYRSIKNLTDSTGGANHWMTEDTFSNPEKVKRDVYDLLKLDPQSTARTERVEEEKEERDPWQMTLQEFVNSVVHFVDVFNSYPSVITNNLKIIAEYESPQGGTNEFSLVKPTVSKAKLYAGIVHEASVRKAFLKDGYVLPANILEDYPALKNEAENRDTKLLSAEEASEKFKEALSKVMAAKLLLEFLRTEEEKGKIKFSEVEKQENKFTAAESDFYRWRGKQKVFKDKNGKFKSAKEIELAGLNGIYLQGCKVIEHVFELSFDGTDFKSAENFEGLLNQVGLDPNYTTAYYKKYPNTPPVYLWQGKGIRMVTANNPLLTNGYASSIGIEGEKEKVSAAAGYIEKFTGSWGEYGLNYIGFDGYTFDDPKDEGPSNGPVNSPGTDTSKKAGEKLSTEAYKEKFLKGFDAALNSDNKFEAAALINELYQEILKGHFMELTPLLIDRAQNPKIKTALKYTYDGLTDIYDKLIENEEFKKHLDTNLWNLVPGEYKKIKNIKPVAWEPDPENAGLISILKNFLSKDTLRPAFLTANFEKEGIVATDADKLIFLDKVWKGKKGMYCLTELCFKNFDHQENPVTSTFKYPEYQQLIPKTSPVVITVDPVALRQYCNAVIEAGFVPGVKKTAGFRYANDGFIFFNAEKLLQCMEAFLKLGYKEIDLGFNANNKAVLITPTGMNEEAAKQNCPYILLMPQYSDPPPEESNLEKGDLYFDLTDQSVKTSGIKEVIHLSPKNLIPEITTTLDNNMKTKDKDIQDFKGNESTAVKDTPGNALIGDNWFKQNPGKVLGEEYQTTNRFNKPVTKIKGDIENLRGIDVPEVDLPQDRDEALDTEIKEPLEYLLNDPVKKKNIEAVIAKTIQEHADKAVAKIKGEKDKYVDGCPEEYYCFDEIMREYNKGITEDEIKAWVWYKRKTKSFNDESIILNKKNGWSKYVVPLGEVRQHFGDWLKKGIICYYAGDFMPSVLYYAENIYERQSMLLQEKGTITSNYGHEQYDRQWEGLENVKLPRLTLTDPVISNRLFIKPDSGFAKETNVKQLSDGTTFRSYNAKSKQFTEGESSIVDAFAKWLEGLPKDSFKKSTSWDITNYYLHGGTPGRHFDKEEKLRLKQNAKMEGDKFFVQFLAEALTREDQLRIEQVWNSKYNGYVEINYFKVPVAFTCSSTFKNKPLFIRAAQREGIGFISVHGSGCIAFDVGLGKTMTAILSLAQALEYGQCKRPFIVVPNQTYKNWLSEIGGMVDKGKVILSGLLPQYQVIGLYNLGTEYIDQLRDEHGHIRPVPEFSISVMTYEGFNRLGFNDDTWDTIGEELYAILNQGIEKEREQEKLSEKIEEMMGKGIKGGMVNIEDLGFDYLVTDEAHAMKKSFTQVKGEVKGDDESREKASYQIKSGQPSMTALRGFMVSQYILRNNRMRNVQLLTATPFTNSPLEIYSMLALVGYQQLEKSGIKNIKEFFDTFIKTSTELIINAKLKPERREIVMGFHNLVSLQQLIFKFIIYKTGEDAKIQRPNKIVLPMLNERIGNEVIPLPPAKQISTNLPMTEEQKGYMADVEAYVTGSVSLTNFCVNTKGLEEEEENGENEYAGEALDEGHMSEDELEGTRILRGMSFARQLALSPYLYACNPKKHPTAKEYIESSPKLLYIMQCIESVKHYHEEHGEDVSGQVIYMNAGVHFFPLIKEYLIQKVGYKESEVGIIKSGMSAPKKEGIKERFLAGTVKIIIGSASIKEGINLQNRATVLYNCWLDWNPTDIKQLEGRIWRFGNIFANVRIVNPLMENSIDTFIFQKLEEKTSRINEIWYRAGKTNELNLEEFNPSELKMGLVTDPHALAELILMEERENIQDEITSLQNQKEVINNIAESRDIFNKNIDHVRNTANNYRPMEEGKTRNQDTIFKIYKDYLDDEHSGHDYNDEIIFDRVRKANAVLKRGVEQILSPRGLSIDFDPKKVITAMEKEITAKEKYKEEKTGKEAIKKKAGEIIADRVKKGYKPKTVKERVQEFAKLNPVVLSEMMVYDNTEESKIKRKQQHEKGAALESADDDIREMEELMKIIEENVSMIKEMEELLAA